MPLERDTLLNSRYQIQEILGEGGMGAVYKAVDVNLGLTVAVKENLFTTDEYARQFRLEGLILASLRHPNLARVTDHFELDKTQYLVMDHIQGEDLRDRMDRLGVLDDAEAITIGIAICDALTYMHTKEPPVLHRDIKPGNVRIGFSGQIYLVDFGLAKVALEGQITVTGARAMTPGYSPPEQYGSARTDARSDVYSLGATLYSALTGALPEDGLAQAMNQVELTPLRRHNPRVSRRLATVIEKALAVQAEDRFQSAADFRKALIDSRGVTLRRPSFPAAVVDPPPVTVAPIGGDDTPVVKVEENSSPPAEKESEPAWSPLMVSSTLADKAPPTETRPESSTRWIGWVIGLLLLVAGFVVIDRFFPDLTNAALGAILPPAATGTPDRPRETLAASASRTAAALAGRPSGTASPATMIDDPTASPTESPPPTVRPTGRPSSPTTTPVPAATPIGGAALIAFATDRSGDVQIWLMNSDGSNQRQLTNLTGGACQPDWSPDGSRLVFISPCAGEQEDYRESALFIINIDGSGLIPLVGSRGGDYDPAWSPDGSQIAFTSLRNVTPHVFVYNLDSEQVTLIADLGWNYQPSWSQDGSKIVFISTRRGPFQIWIMNPDGSEPIGFSRSGDLKDTSPSFSPDGSFLVFTQRQLPEGIPVIVLAPFEANGFSEIEMTPDTIPSRSAVFSPDGAWLVYESWPDGLNHDLYLIDLNTALVIRLTDQPSFEFDPAWQPVP